MYKVSRPYVVLSGYYVGIILLLSEMDQSDCEFRGNYP